MAPSAGPVGAAMLLAAVVPMHVAYSTPPSGTFLNQAAALGLWGVVVVVLGWRGAPLSRAAWAPVAPLLLALGLLGTAALSSWGLGRLPGSAALGALGVVAALGAMALSGASARARPDAVRLRELFFAGWLASGTLTALICAVQVFAPGWTDGTWIALSSADGRAIGNLRQANQASSLMLWAAVSVIPLRESGRIGRGAAVALFAMAIGGVVLTGSRTGIVCVVGLVLWGLVDARLARSSRSLLASAVVWFALFWLLSTAWAGVTGRHVGGVERMADQGLSSSRFDLWANALALVARSPWAGTGFGQFNFAWTLTPAPARSGEFFDHAHNIVLQLAAELGLPLAGLVLALFVWSLWRAWRQCVGEPAPGGTGLRATFAMVLVMVLHSQLEYPLWFAFFSLPTAWAWGHCLGRRPHAAEAGASAPAASHRPLLAIAGLAMVAGAAGALFDYARVTPIYSATSDAQLAERIQAGQRSWLFSHHADYAAAVTATGPAQALPPLVRAMHVNLDDQLLVVLARTLAMQGDLERARHVAQRLREFRTRRAADFIAACEAGTIQPPAFRCEAPTQSLDWRDFR